MNLNKLTNDAMAIEGLTEIEEVVMLYQLCLAAPKAGWLVELGSYLGRSSIAICQAAQETRRQAKVMLIDNFGKIQKKGWENKAASKDKLMMSLSVLGYWPVIIDGDSRQVPERLSTGRQVSLLFVDSDHAPEHFESEMDVWLDRLVPGAVIACHDYANPKCSGLKAAIDRRLGKLERLQLAKSTIAFKWGGS